MHNLTIDNDLFHLPSNWNDFTVEQFMRVAELSINILPVGEFRLKLFLTITGLRVSPKPEITINGEQCFYLNHGKTREYLVSSSELAAICSTLDFMFISTKNKSGDELLLIDCQMYIQLLPTIKVGKELWYGPASALSNILFAEWIHTETAYNHYNKTRKHQFIDRLIATLYRPGLPQGYQNMEPTGDDREKFNDALLDKYTRMVSGIDPVVKNAIFMWYEGCRSFIVKKFPDVFAQKKPSKKQMDVFESFLYLVNALTNNDVTKTEQVRQSYMMEVMVTLNALAMQLNELEEKKTKR